MDILILVIILVAALGFFAWLMIYIIKRHFLSKSGDLSSLSEKMLAQLNEVTNQVNERLRENTNQVNLRLRENLEMMQRQNQDLNQRLDNTQKIVQSVTNKLAGLEESSKRIFEVGKDISSLHDILRAPKLRGGLGEYVLEDILEQILPRDHYKSQHSFKDGEKVDAVVKLREMLIPIDAKFPLENFQQVLGAKDKHEKIRAKKQFLRDVRKHIDAIANKYIRPHEGTSDFALMYVPAENVYYEIILKEKEADSISSYAFSKKIIPVSPNSFYAYLQAILIGLRGFQIEKSAKEILTKLSRLKTDFSKFGNDFSLLGKHLNHAHSTYETSEKKLSRLNQNLTNLETPQNKKRLSEKSASDD